MWWKVRTDNESLIFNARLRRELEARTDDRIVTLHDHGDGTSCALLSGGIADHLRASLRDGDMSPATADDLVEAGVTTGADSEVERHDA